LGAYAVGIPAHHWLYGGMDVIATTNGFVQFGLALLVSGIFALLTGLICLKVKGVYFIMITMAFAQMVYYLFISIAEYGGDDGLVIDTRSEFPLVNFDNSTQLFTICAVSLFFVMWLVWRISKSQFGMVLAGIKGNEQRMIAMGYNTFVYKLAAYVISGMICGFSGALLGNFTTFISPEMIDWARTIGCDYLHHIGRGAFNHYDLLAPAIWPTSYWRRYVCEGWSFCTDTKSGG
jgi:branched-chain amino acid transport system permease protein